MVKSRPVLSHLISTVKMGALSLPLSLTPSLIQHIYHA